MLHLKLLPQLSDNMKILPEQGPAAAAFFCFKLEAHVSIISYIFVWLTKIDASLYRGWPVIWGTYHRGCLLSVPFHCDTKTKFWALRQVTERSPDNIRSRRYVSVYITSYIVDFVCNSYDFTLTTAFLTNI